MMKSRHPAYTKCGLMSLGKRVNRPSWKNPKPQARRKWGWARLIGLLTNTENSFTVAEKPIGAFPLYDR